jgi:hypothetical protein
METTCKAKGKKITQQYERKSDVKCVWSWMDDGGFYLYEKRVWMNCEGGRQAWVVELGHTFWVIGLFMPAFIEDRIKVNV